MEKLVRHSFEARQGGDNEKLPQSQSEGNDGLSKGGQVVLVSAAYLFDKSMEAQPLKHSRNGRWAFVGEKWLQGLISEAGDIELTPGNNE